MLHVEYVGAESLMAFVVSFLLASPRSVLFCNWAEASLGRTDTRDGGRTCSHGRRSQRFLRSCKLWMCVFVSVCMYFCMWYVLARGFGAMSCDALVISLPVPWAGVARRGKGGAVNRAWSWCHSALHFIRVQRGDAGPPRVVPLHGRVSVRRHSPMRQAGGCTV